MQMQYYCVDCRHSWALDSTNCKQQFIGRTKVDNDLKKEIRYKNVYEKLMEMKDENDKVPMRLEGHCYCGCLFPENRSFKSLDEKNRLVQVRQRIR